VKSCVFITIGERINATRKSIREAIAARNADTIRAEAVMQAEAGASAIDINGGTNPEEEVENLSWIIDIVAPAVSKPFCIDSADPKALSFAARRIIELSGRRPPESGLDENGIPWLIINSISAEKERYDGVLPILQEYRASVVALALDDTGMPEDAEKRIAVGGALIERLLSDGLTPERILADPLIMPAGVNTGAGPMIVETVRALRASFPAVHITCGLTNVSHGLPARKLLNRTFLAVLVAAGLDSAILDPTDRGLMSALRAALALAGRDPYCSNFIAAFRSGLLDV
jgi:5-methyltetrahydrofolate--homocysteine methyltransferase